MQNKSTPRSTTAKEPTARQLGIILVAEAIAGPGRSAQVNSAVYGGNYSEFGDFVTKELVAEQWANPDRFVAKLGELRRAGKRDSGGPK
jgi:hypothetical protein